MKLYFIYNIKEDLLLYKRNGDFVQGKLEKCNAKRALNYHVKESKTDRYGYPNKNGELQDYIVIQVEIR